MQKKLEKYVLDFQLGLDWSDEQFLDDFLDWENSAAICFNNM